jgi:hypothetical protein
MLPATQFYLPTTTALERGLRAGCRLAVALLVSWLAVDAALSYASCGHYVRDRLNPHVGHALAGFGQPVDDAIRWMLVGGRDAEGEWRVPSGRLLRPLAGSPWNPEGPPSPLAPCHGPSCRAPQLPLSPASLANLFVLADDPSSAATPPASRAEVRASQRPRMPRPQSDSLPPPLAQGLFKPPC